MQQWEAKPDGRSLGSAIHPSHHAGGTTAPRVLEDRPPLPEPYLHAVFTQHWPNVGRNWVDLGEVWWVQGRKPLQPSRGDLPHKMGAGEKAGEEQGRRTTVHGHSLHKTSWFCQLEMQKGPRSLPTLFIH